MAFTSTVRETSPYYPPRARWWSPLLCFFDRLKRRLPLESLPKIAFSSALVGAFLVPGLAVYLRGPRLLGGVALGLAALLAFTFVVFVGHAVGNLAFGMLLSLHTSGFVYYLAPLLQKSLSRRLVTTVLTLAGLSLLIYTPLEHLLEETCFTPLQIKNHVVITHPIRSPGSLRSGDWVTYSIPASSEYGEGGINVMSGIGMSPILACPGDFVEFSATTFSINGMPHPSLAHMPVSGALRITKDHWFIWPNLDMHEHGMIAEERKSKTLLHLALVAKAQLLGMPFHRWFWWRQLYL